MLEIREKYYNILELSCQSNRLFNLTIFDGLRCIFNKLPHSVCFGAPKLVASYIDHLMKQGSHSTTTWDTEIEKVFTLSHHLDSDLRIQLQDLQQIFRHNFVERLQIGEVRSIWLSSKEEAKEMLQNCSILLKKTIDQLRPFLEPCFATISFQTADQSLREWLQSLFLPKHGKKIYCALRALLPHYNGRVMSAIITLFYVLIYFCLFI